MRRSRWDQLYETAAQQDGLFTVQQATNAGLYRQLLHSYVQFGKAQRLRRGIYRLVHYPPSEHEELTVLWLWSNRTGVFSHDTALSLHGLSDILPKRAHLSIPPTWGRRIRSAPDGLVLHRVEVLKAERTWFGSVPVTTVGRTLLDCASAHVSPELMAQAIDQAQARGLVDAEVLRRVRRIVALLRSHR